MKKSVIKALVTFLILGICQSPAYAEETAANSETEVSSEASKDYIGIFYAEPDGYEDLPDALKYEYNEEYELKYHDKVEQYYKEHRQEFEYTPEEKALVESIAASIDDENNKKEYATGTFRFSIDDETIDSLGIDAKILELCIFHNGTKSEKFYLKKEDNYSTEATLAEGKYTIGYLRDFYNKDTEYSLKQNSFNLKAGEIYETTVAPYIDPYEYNGYKKLTKEEIEESKKEIIENIPELPLKDRFIAFIGQIYLNKKLPLIILCIAGFVMIPYFILKSRKKKRKEKNDFIIWH